MRLKFASEPPPGASSIPFEGPLEARVRDAARRLGFDAVGIARADVPLGADFARYQTFLDEGMNGEMDWLAENAEARRRLDSSDILDGAKSVICLARRYQRAPEDEAEDPPTARAIARYARGRDYHNGIRKKLRRLAAWLRTLGTPEAPVSARPMIDSAPVLERAWAARAGLGFVGKNGLIIVPGEGSLVLLGEVVTTLALAPDTPMAERCGSCTRCLDVCPTQAIVRPFVVDPRRCVAYLTIEHRSAIPEDLRDGVGEHLFGCDDCQTVCPFNASARPRPKEATRSFEPAARWGEIGLGELVLLDPQAWAELTLGSPVHRATAEGLARNAAICLGNGGDREALGPLRTAAAEHPSAIVREAAAWAERKLSHGAGENDHTPGQSPK